jgi:hypothetical protein
MTVDELIDRAKCFSSFASFAELIGISLLQRISQSLSGENVSSPDPVQGDILSVEIGDEGWFADITIKDLSSGGIYAERLGLGTNNDPASGSPLIVFNVTSKGFDDSGDPTTIQRTVYGVCPVAKQYPNHAENQETEAGGNVTVRIALSDYIYSKDKTGAGNSGVDVTASIGAGFYSQGGTPNNARASIVVSNNSDAEFQPAIPKWSWPGYQRVTGAFKLRAVAFHRHGQQRRPVRAVRFTVTDGVTTQHLFSTTPIIDSDMAADQVPVIEYTAEFDAADFAQGPLTANFTVYPWVGDNAFHSADGPDQPTPNPTAMTLVNDKAGTYGVTMAKVDPVSGNNATALAYDSGSYDFDTANAFETIAAAARAIRDFNNANNSRDNTGGGIIELVAGSYSWMGATISGGYGGTPDTWLTVRAGPGVARDDVLITGISGDRNPGNRLKIEGVKITSTTAQTFHLVGQVWAHNCEFDCNNNSLVTGSGIWYVTHSLIKMLALSMRPTSSVNRPCAIIRGNEFNGQSGQIVVYCCIGNRRSAKTSTGHTFNDSTTAAMKPTGLIWAFNEIWGYRVDVPSNVQGWGTSDNQTDGIAIVQNILENTTDGVSGLGDIVNDGGGNQVDNVIVWNNLFVGQRVQVGYDSTGTEKKHRRYWSIKNNYFDARGHKSDVFDEKPDPVGNWPVMYQVGCSGNIHGGVSAIAASNFHAYYAGLSSIQLSNQNATWPKFEDPKRWDGASEGGGFGDYHPQSDSPLKGLAIESVLPFDIEGNQRPSANDDVGVYAG